MHDTQTVEERNDVLGYQTGLRSRSCDFRNLLGGRYARRHSDKNQDSGIFPLSGAAFSIGQVGHGVRVYVQSINYRGGINGCKIDDVMLDDAYSPPKAFEHARRLVESNEVDFMFSQLGTAGDSVPAGSSLVKFATRALK